MVVVVCLWNLIFIVFIICDVFIGDCVLELLKELCVGKWMFVICLYYCGVSDDFLLFLFGVKNFEFFEVYGMGIDLDVVS